MTIAKRQQYRALLLTTIFSLYGCTGSPLSDQETKKMHDINILQSESVQPIKKTDIGRLQSISGAANHPQKSKSSIHRAQTSTMAEIAAKGLAFNFNMVENDFHLPVYPQFQQES